MFRTSRQYLPLRGWLVLVASLLAVAASMSFTGARARADALPDCAGPYSIGVDGPEGSGTTQPPESAVVLRVLNHAGALMPTTCPGGAVFFYWRATPADVDVAPWPLANTPGPANEVLALGQHDGETATLAVMITTLAYYTGPFVPDAQITLQYSDPGLSGTTVSLSPSAPSAGAVTTLTAAAATNPSGVASVAWDFGDGTSATGNGGALSVPHVYRTAGDYTASVTLTDPFGKTDSAQLPFHVSAPLTPAFSLSASTVGVGQGIEVDGSRSSTDPSATITGWTWDFGDRRNTLVAGRSTSYAYAFSGTYTITETVTDSLGRTATATRDVTVQDVPAGGGGDPGPSGGPQAAWSLATTSPVAGALTAFDGTGSSDDGGTIVNYAWSYGDGLTGNGASPRHVFGDGGSYPVTLTVTDDAGHSSSVTHQVSVAYAPPVAAFTDGPSSPAVGDTVAFDGTGSSVPAPGPVSYAWAFGDGAAASGATTTHAFPAKGSYPVTLTVTDAGGRSASVTHVVTTQWGATDLAVSVGGSIPKAGRYTYRVTIKNLGQVAAHGVVLLNTLDPTQVLAVKASGPAGVPCGGVALGATGTVTCTAGPSAVLAPGTSWVVTFTVKQPTAPRVRMVTEASSVSAGNPDPVGANNSATRSTVLAIKH